MVVSSHGGSVAWDRVVVDGGGRPVAIELRDSALVELRDVVVEGSALGILLDGARAGMADRVTVTAGRVGIDWHGEAVAWRWQDLRVDAPEAAIGLAAEVAVTGSGADRAALAAVPQ